MKQVVTELFTAFTVAGGMILLALIVFKAQPTPVQEPAPVKAECVCE